LTRAIPSLAVVVGAGSLTALKWRVICMRKPVQRMALMVALAVLLGALGLSFPAAHAQKDKDKGKATATAVFELYKDSAGEFRFRLKDDEGTLLAASGKGYKAKADCQKVIDTIRKEAAKAKLDDQAK
jgi:uncharacterized protein YegP (UPF0339 family)